MEQLIKLFAKHQLLDKLAEKYTLLIDEKNVNNGALFFLEANGKSYKVIVAAPHHEALLKEGSPSIKAVLQHKEAMYLK